MANTPAAGQTAKNTTKPTKPPAPTWHELARVTARKEIRWQRGGTRTHWLACGTGWDVVSVEPMAAGLQALAAMGASTRRGYWVIADHLRDRLYVAVPTGCGDAFKDIGGVRLLSKGHQLLIPSTHEDATVSADWISHPRGSKPPALIDAERFAAHLRGTNAPTTPEKAPAS
ncbi:hypothetical protein ACFVYR_37850 [Streptomyces sp. NPDC058284]|uniref:hypothetical protein n=1 Tax=unclassified Streptomyces TaxID=2593676 RepID=UPI00364DEB01